MVVKLGRIELESITLNEQVNLLNEGHIRNSLAE
jgi:hypothetical protein